MAVDQMQQGVFAALRLTRAAIIGLAAASLMTGCSTLSRPFGKGKTPVVGTLLEQAPPVAIVSIKGAPARVGDRIADAIRAEAELRGIDTHSNPPGQRDFRIKGALSASVEPVGVVVDHTWEVTDAIGAGRHRIAGRQIVHDAGGKNPWRAVDKAVARRIAAFTAENLAMFLGQRGYNVRSIALAPDPSNPPAAPGAPGQMRAGTPPPSTARRRMAPVPKAETAVMTAPVVVPDVTGSDPASGRSLAQAMRSALARHGVKLAEKPDADAHKVVGSVKVGSRKGGKQPVSVAWKVLDREDAFVGDVKQNNEVPAGTLANGWAPIAKLVADAAAEGVLKLLIQAR